MARAGLLLGAVAVALSLQGLTFVTSPPSGALDGAHGCAHLRGAQATGSLAGATNTAAFNLSASQVAAGVVLVAMAGLWCRGRAQSAVLRNALGVGQKVSWNGKPGTVAYVGPVKFASGNWVGVSLEGAGGMHDGTVMGVEYFSCAPRTGIFATEASLTATGAAPAPVSSTAAPVAPASELDCSAGKIEMCVGCKVLWNGKPGTVAYIGSTKFAQGEWVGVDLDVPSGMHDGTVMGVTYFAGKPKHGIFAAPSGLTVTAPAP